MKFKIVSKLLCLVILGLPVFVNIFAQTVTKLPDGVKYTASVEGITEFQLANGMRVLLYPDQTKQTTTVNVTYLVGSKHENYGETGMAHLLEHMVFKGTPKHPNIPQELTSHGTRPNGSTWYDRTNYFESFASSDENLEWALNMESDRMINSFIARKDLDSEFSVVRNEMESGENDPFSITIEKTMSTAYQWHNYGKDTIGARSDVENVNIERLQAFYKKYYQPDNAVLLVAGKFDQEKTLGLIQKYFGAIPKPNLKLPDIYTVEPTQDVERQVTEGRVGDIQVLIAGYHFPPAAHQEGALTDLLSSALTDEPSGRLYKALVETKKAASVSYFTPPTRDSSYVMFIVQIPKEKSIEDAKNTLIDTLENLSKTPITKDEIERAKNAGLTQIDLNLNDPNRVGLELSEFIAQGDWRLLFINRDRIKKATVEDVQKLGQTYLKQSNRTVGLFLPTNKPDRAEIPKIKDTEITALVKDYKGDAVASAGEVFDPSTTNIETRTKRTQIGGVKLALLAKKNRGESVFANIKLDFGDEKSLMNRATAAGFTGDMLMRGTAKHTRQQIKDEFDRLKARVFIYGGASGVYANIETTRANLPAVLNLIGEILREPSFPANEFDLLKQEQITNYEASKTEPQTVAGTAMSQYFNIYPKGHPNYAGSFDENLAELKAVTLEQVKNFHKDFYGASNGEMTVIGDFDEKEISDSVQKLFGNWKSPKPFTRIPATFKDFSAVNKAFETPDKANAFFLARLNVKMRDDNPDYPAMVLGNYILGGGFLNSRLAVRLRQKEGFSYGVGSQFGTSSLDENGTFIVYAIYAPQNADKLEAAFKEEIVKILKDGITAQELEDARKGFLQSRQLSRSQDRELSGRLNNYLFINRTLVWDADFENKIKAVTPEQIKTTLNKYLSADKISIFKAGDFAKKQ